MMLPVFTLNHLTLLSLEHDCNLWTALHHITSRYVGWWWGMSEKKTFNIVYDVVWYTSQLFRHHYTASPHITKFWNLLAIYLSSFPVTIILPAPQTYKLILLHCSTAMQHYCAWHIITQNTLQHLPYHSWALHSIPCNHIQSLVTSPTIL